MIFVRGVCKVQQIIIEYEKNKKELSTDFFTKLL